MMVADDHELFVHTASAMLRADPSFEVVGTAADGGAAVAAAVEHQPDVVLMDLNMPVMNGIDATRQLRDAAPHVAVLMLTMYDDDESVFAAMRAGARGYVLKGARQDELARAVMAAAAGEVLFGQAIARRMVDYFSAATAPSTEAFPGLTDREQEVLDLLAAGRDNTFIAVQLYLSAKTVRNYVSSILTKLQVATRSEAIVKARDAGFGNT